MTYFLSAKLQTVFVMLLVFQCMMIIGCGEDRKEVGKKPVPAQEAKPDVDVMALARQSFARNDFDAAASHLRGILLTEPDNVLALEMSSEVALRRGDADTALSLLTTAISHSDPPKKATLSKACLLYTSDAADE